MVRLQKNSRISIIYPLPVNVWPYALEVWNIQLAPLEQVDAITEIKLNLSSI